MTSTGLISSISQASIGLSSECCDSHGNQPTSELAVKSVCGRNSESPLRLCVRVCVEEKKVESERERKECVCVVREKKVECV